VGKRRKGGKNSGRGFGAGFESAGREGHGDKSIGKKPREKRHRVMTLYHAGKKPLRSVPLLKTPFLSKKPEQISFF